MFLFCDGFDNYSSAEDLWQKWSLDHPRQYASVQYDYIGEGWDWSNNEGLTGGGCLKHTGAAGSRFGRAVRRRDNYDFNEKGRDHFWFRINGYPAEQFPLIEWFQEGGQFGDVSTFNPGTNRTALEITPEGTLVQKGHHPATYATPIILFTGNADVCDNKWHCIERHWILNSNSAVGHFTLKLDGFTLFDADAQTTPSGRHSNVIAFHSLGVPMYIDDVIVWDDEVETVNADGLGKYWFSESPLERFPEQGNDGFVGPIGMCRIATLRPEANGSLNNFDVEGAAANYDAVNDAGGHDGDTTYVESNVTGNTDRYVMEDFLSNTQILSAVLSFRHRAFEAGSAVIRPEVINEGVLAEGYRRSMNGLFKPDFDLSLPNLITNGGPNFADLTGWTATKDADLSIVDGELRVTQVVEGSPGAITSIATEVNKVYRVRMKRSDDPNQGNSGSLYIRRSTDTTQYITRAFGISIGNMAEVTFIAADEVTYVELVCTNADYAQFEYVIAGLDVIQFTYHPRQWALRKDPATDALWTKEGLNTAEFGIRIASGII